MSAQGRLPDAYLHGLARTSWPGRGEIVHDVGFYPRNLNGEAKHNDLKMGTLTFYLDGAHTPESLEACAKWFSSAAAGENAHGKRKHVGSHSNGSEISNGQCTTNSVMEKMNSKRVSG